MANRVWKVVYSKVFGRSRHISQNKFFHPSTASTRKGDDGDYGGKNKENKNVFIGH